MELHFKTNSNAQVSCNNKIEEFPNCSTILPILQQEYELEKVRTDRIDNKIFVFLSVIIALITIYIPIIPFDRFVSYYTNLDIPCAEKILFSSFVIMGCIAIFLAGYSLYKLVNAYKTKNFHSVNINVFCTNEELIVSPSKFKLDLIDHYKSIILQDAEINTNKASIVDFQFKIIIAIFSLLFLSSAGMLVFIN